MSSPEIITTLVTVYFHQFKQESEQLQIQVQARTYAKAGAALFSIQPKTDKHTRQHTQLETRTMTTSPGEIKWQP